MREPWMDISDRSLWPSPRGGEAESGDEANHFPQEFGGLAEGGSENQGDIAGRAVDKAMDGKGGDRRGLPPLAATVEETARVPGGEETGLDRVGREIEATAGEGDRVGGAKEIGNHWFPSQESHRRKRKKGESGGK